MLVQPTEPTARVWWMSLKAFKFCSTNHLSTRVVETRTATGSELFSLLTCLHTITFTLLSIFSPLKMISIKIWETPLPWLAKCSLPVAVRDSKTTIPIFLTWGRYGNPSGMKTLWAALYLGEKMTIFLQMLTSFTKPQIWSFHVVVLLTTAKK